MIDFYPQLLDTNVMVHYCRRSPLSDWIERNFRLMASPDRPLISVVTHGELLSFANQLGWVKHKVQSLEELLQEVVIVDINDPSILEAYAAMDDFSRKCVPSVNMGKNDLWIAATAHVLKVPLLTTDGDFDHLDGTWIKRIYIDPEIVKPQP